VRWGEANGKPTVFIMNSWDNPATKAMLVGLPSRLVVWGEQTRDHAIRHMNVPPERVIGLGVAQFDLYRNPPMETPADYKGRLGVPLGHKVLLYAGSSNGLNETNHLLRLEEAVERGELKNCVILYRPHPWRAYPAGEKDYHSLAWKHVTLDPAMEACYRTSRKKERIHVELANYENTHVTLSAVDAVISPLSTILLEAALHGKPVAAYLPNEGIKKNQSVTTRARMIHFLEFFDRVDCIKCESPDDLIEDCRRLLQKADEPGIGERLKKQCAYFVEPSNRPYAERLNDLILSMVSSPSPGSGVQRAESPER
jgi:CDP-glycerol glycerophosphotransferase (TagB/SpsB family)